MDDDDEFLTPLRDLSKHIYHGRLYLTVRTGEEPDANATLPEAFEAQDVLVWYHWESVHTLEIDFSAVSGKLRDEVCAYYRKEFPRTRIFVASGSLRTNPGDWREYDYI